MKKFHTSTIKQLADSLTGSLPKTPEEWKTFLAQRTAPVVLVHDNKINSSVNEHLATVGKAFRVRMNALVDEGFREHYEHRPTCEDCRSFITNGSADGQTGYKNAMEQEVERMLTRTRDYVSATAVAIVGVLARKDMPRSIRATMLSEAMTSMLVIFDFGVASALTMLCDAQATPDAMNSDWFENGFRGQYAPMNRLQLSGFENSIWLPLVEVMGYLLDNNLSDAAAETLVDGWFARTQVEAPARAKAELDKRLQSIADDLKMKGVPPPVVDAAVSSVRNMLSKAAASSLRNMLSKAAASSHGDGVGVRIDAATGKVTPLTDEELEKMKDVMLGAPGRTLH